MVREGSKNGMTAKTGTDWRPAIVPALALIAIGVLPPLLKGLYEPFTANLMRAYVAFGMLFMVAICGGLAMMIFRDISARRQKVFRLAPDHQPVREVDGAVRVESSEE
jgi:hypothetical protein